MGSFPETTTRSGLYVDVEKLVGAVAGGVAGSES